MGYYDEDGDWIGGEKIDGDKVEGKTYLGDKIVGNFSIKHDIPEDCFVFLKGTGYDYECSVCHKRYKVVLK